MMRTNGIPVRRYAAPMLVVALTASVWAASGVRAEEKARGDADAKASTPSDVEGNDVTADYALSVRPSIDPIQFAQPFDLVIEVTRADGERLGIPESIPENKKVRRAGRPRREREGRPDGRVTERIYIPFIALDTDDVSTPALVIRAPGRGAPNADGRVVEGRIEVPAQTLRVVDPELNPVGGGARGGPAGVDGPGAPGSVAPKKAPSAGIEPARSHFLYNVADARPWTVLATLVASLAALFASMAIDRRRRFSVRKEDDPVLVARVKTRPAHEVALEKLDSLLASNLLRDGEVEAFVEQLMDDVLRAYLEARFEVPAGTHTTAELAEDLLQVAHVDLDLSLVRSLLEDTDLVKFARAEMQGDVAHQMAGKVRALIESTAARPEPTGEET